MRKKERRASLYLSLVSVCLTIIAVDSLGRAVRSRPATHSYPPLPVLRLYDVNIHNDTMIVGDLNPPLKPSPAVEQHQYSFTTDAYGYRNLSNGPVELIALGDSYGIGTVSDGETWPVVLSGLTGREAYNLSMPDYSPWQEYMTLSNEADRLNAPEGTYLIWMLFPANDLEGEYHPVMDIQQLRRLGPWEQILVQLGDYSQQSFVSHLIGAAFGPQDTPGDQTILVDLNGPALMYRPYLQRAGMTVQDVRRHQNYPLLLKTIGAMKNEAHDRGLHLVIVLAPSKEEVYGHTVDGHPDWQMSAGPGALADVLAQDDICFLDLRPGFATEAERQYAQTGDLLWWRDDTHWNVAGNSLAAGLISDYLNSSLDCGY